MINPDINTYKHSIDSDQVTKMEASHVGHHPSKL